MPANPALLCNYNSPVKKIMRTFKKGFTLGCLLTHVCFSYEWSYISL